QTSLDLRTAAPFLLILHPTSPPPPPSTLFPYTTLFRSSLLPPAAACQAGPASAGAPHGRLGAGALPATSRQGARARAPWRDVARSEEHTSELQSRFDLVCRLLLEKKKNKLTTPHPRPRT